MNFASAYVNFDVSDCEDEELELGNRHQLVYSDCERNDFESDDSESESGSGSEEDEEIESPKLARKLVQQQQLKVESPEIDSLPQRTKTLRIKKADTNILSLNIGEALLEEAPIMTGDPIICKHCHSILSQITKLENTTEVDERITGTWKCEFCSHEQEVSFEKEELPTQESSDYLVNDMVENIEAEKRLNFGAVTEGDGLTVLCIDISGSMCVSTEIKGKHKLKGFERVLKKYEELNPEGEDQYFPNQQKNVSYISRLQCVQAAIVSQIESLEKNAPNSKVCLITFNNDVNIIGDGSQAVSVLSGGTLSNFEQLLEKAKGYDIVTPVSHSSKILCDKIFGLEETGATALGPALLASIAIASKNRGSKVILCTDGKANIGLGNLDIDEDQLENVASFYTQLGDLAKENGTSVSVMSIKGTDCRMEYLGAVADATGGDAHVVDPLKLTNEFANILAEQVIATNITLSLRLHEGLYCKEETEEEKNEEKEESQLIVRHLGNATKETLTTFEYGIKKGYNTEGIQALPFQVQIRYSRVSSSNDLIRVITKLHPITRDREVAMKSADIKVLGTHAAQQSASLAMKGEYSKARAKAYQTKEFMKNVVSKATNNEQQQMYSNWKSNIVGMERSLQQVQMKEEDDGLCYSDDECDEEEISREDERKQRRDKKSKARKTTREDKSSTRLLSLKKAKNLF